MKSQVELQEYRDRSRTSLCFTSRQIKGLRILSDVTDHLKESKEEEVLGIASELNQIRYVIEKGILDMKSMKYKSFLLRAGKHLRGMQ